MSKACLERCVVNAWYGRHKWLWLLLPFSLVFGCIAFLRKHYLVYFRQNEAKLPVIVVGNITVGGSGKTPLTVHIANQLKNSGYRPVIMTRGYGVNHHVPRLVHENDSAKDVGDEAILLARQSNTPVIVCVNRNLSVEYAYKQDLGNVVISDDGLQQYKLSRVFEIVAIDGKKLLGNGLLLPAGPLRELPSRLKTVDAIAIKGAFKHQFDANFCFNFDLVPSSMYDLSGQQRSLDFIKGKTIHAVAGIAHPDSFFELLESLGATVIPHSFSDHHEYKQEQISFGDNLPIVMTEKDAVKCSEFELTNVWSIPVSAVISKENSKKLLEAIEARVS